MSSDRWKEIKMGECCFFQEGYVNPSQMHPEYFGDEVKWIRANDLNNGYVYETTRRLSKRGFASAGKSVQLFKPDTIVISKSGTIGRLGIIKDFMCGNRATINIETDPKKASLKYIFYSLLNKQGEIEDMAVGSVQRNLYVSVLSNVRLLLPALAEQRAISATLSALDDKIEINNSINKTLEEIAQALFKRWFVDFEFPDENGLPYKSSGGEMEESELGLIPKGWKVESLDSIADYLNGLAMQKYRPEGDVFIPVIKIRELNQGKSDVQSDKASPNIDSKYIVNDGDVLFSWSGSLDVKIWCGGKGGLNQHLFKVTSVRYEKWFYYLWTKHHLEKFRGIAQDKATTMGHIQRKHLAESLVIVPEGIIYAKFDEVMVPLFNLFVNYAIEGEKILALRESLLPKLMSGEIRVPIEEVTAHV